jgi:hypothetical protein
LPELEVLCMAYQCINQLTSGTTYDSYNMITGRKI